MTATQTTSPSTTPETTTTNELNTSTAQQKSEALADMVKAVATKTVKAPAKKRAPSVTTMTLPVIPAATPIITKPVRKPVLKAVAKAAPVTPAKPATKAPLKSTETTAAPIAKPLTEKLLKDKKPKLVRDSFTIPKVEYLMLDQLKQRSGTLGSSVKKSELIRAGIKALALMSDIGFLAAIKAVPTIKTGRPSND